MLKRTKIKSNSQIFKQQSLIIYSHLEECLANNPPETVLEIFNNLFIKGTGYQVVEIRSCLTAIIESIIIDREFYSFLNRCCQIIISFWYDQPHERKNIISLIAKFDMALPPGSRHSKAARRMRELVKNFKETDYYIKLKFLETIIKYDLANNELQLNTELEQLIVRYPFLYKNCLLSEESNIIFQKTVNKIQKKSQHKYEIELSQYITYRVRLLQNTNKPEDSQSFLKLVKNPTLISDRKLDLTLRQYLGKTNSNLSYKDLAQNFLENNKNTKSYQQFKYDLYQYLTIDLNSPYCVAKLNPKIQEYLQEILPNNNKATIDEFTLMRTSCYLIKSLTVDNKKNLDHYVLIDIITNLGTTQAMSLLLKLVLICPKAKPYLEQRLSLLFSHYRSFHKNELIWLINSLEKLQLALTIYFGKIDLSLVKIVLN